MIKKIKLCVNCGIERNSNQFSKRKSRNGNLILNAYCHGCMSYRMKLWRTKNKEKYRKYQKNYKQKHDKRNL